LGQKLSGLGGFLALIGVVSSVLYLIGYNLRILMWIDTWGPGAAWGIRGGLIVAGAALFFIFGSGDDEDEKKKKKEKEKE
jgi:hypothetical protein